MTIVGGIDERRIVLPESITGNLLNVVAVDTVHLEGYLPGSGYMISAEHVLTAAHVMDGSSDGRVTLAANVADLQRRAPHPTPIAEADYNIAAMTSFDPPSDMALLRVNPPLVSDANVLGMLLAFDHRDLSGLPIDVSGFPWGSPIVQPNNRTDDSGRELMTADGTVVRTSETTVHYSQNLDTEVGQSGSGVVLDVSDLPTSSPLSISPGDLIIGVHTNGTGSTDESNSGYIITKDIYRKISDQMQADFGEDFEARAAILPVNVILGTEAGSETGSGADYMEGSFRREIILGRNGNDTIRGGGGDDFIDGGEGVDWAIYADEFQSFEITYQQNTGFYVVQHNVGAWHQGTDTLKDIEFATFEEGPEGNDIFIVPLPMEDGPTFSQTNALLNAESQEIGSITLETSAWMFDGNVEYEITIDLMPAYNIVYIIDTSHSMSWEDGASAYDNTVLVNFSPKYSNHVLGSPIDQAIKSYNYLTNHFVSTELDKISDFTLLPIGSYNYNSYIDRGFLQADLRFTHDSLFSNSSQIENDLSAIKIGQVLGTNYDLHDLSGGIWNHNPSVKNIVYIISDGQYGHPFSSGTSLLDFAPEGADVEIRAFGVGDADLERLSAVAGGEAFQLTDPEQLFSGNFTTLPKLSSFIDRVELWLNDEEVLEISPDQLIQSDQGLKFQGEIDGLTVSRTARNPLEAKVFFKTEGDEEANSGEVGLVVTTGQEEIFEQSANGSIRVIFKVDQQHHILRQEPMERAAPFSGDAPFAQRTAFAEAPANDDYEIYANHLNNIIDTGGGRVEAYTQKGDDRVFLYEEGGFVDGGAGIDTVVFSQTRAEAGYVSARWSSETASYSGVGVGGHTILQNVEYLEFADHRLRFDGTWQLKEAPLLSTSMDLVEIEEGEEGQAVSAKIRVDLAHAASQDVVVNFQTVDGSAVDGRDFIAKTGSIIIAAGQTYGEIDIDIISDGHIRSDRSFDVLLTALGDATFADGAAQTSARVKIIETGVLFAVSLGGMREAETTEGSWSFSIERYGDARSADFVDFLVRPAGDHPISAADFVGGVLPTGRVEFTAGQTSAQIDLHLLADGLVEGDESFEIVLTPSGSGAQVTEPVRILVRDGDSEEETPPQEGLVLPEIQNTISNADGVVYGTAQNDLIIPKNAQSLAKGGAGDDIIELNGSGGQASGEAGDDVIFMYEKAQVANGGAGADRFVFSGAYADATIQDFNGAEDRIIFGNRAGGVRSFADVVASASQSGADVLLTTLNGVVRIKNLALAALSEEMFDFYSDSSGRLSPEEAASPPETTNMIGGSGWLNGGDANDKITSGGNNVRLLGGFGDDHLISNHWLVNLQGGAGHDFLESHGTDVTMSGGSGSDTFHFASRVDGEILDFEYGIDRVSFGAAAPFEEFDDVVAQMTETANGVVLSSGSGDQLTFRGRKIDDFKEDDFLFFGQGASARQVQDDQQSVQSSGAPSTSSASTSGGAAVVGSGLAAATLTLPELRASDLVEGRAVEEAQINGGPNLAALVGDGERSFSLNMRDDGFASYDNALGVYEVDQDGRIVDARLLVQNANAAPAAPVAIDDVEAGHALGFFIVRDAADWAGSLGASDVLQFVNTSGEGAKLSDGGAVRLAVNGRVTDEVVFHSYASNLNSDGIQHTRFGVGDEGSKITVAFEDMMGGGDRDYEDVVFDLLLVA